MTFRGRVKNGVVVVDRPGRLPEGAEVVIEVAARAKPKKKVKRNAAGLTVGERLMKFAGKAKGLPADLARNHDHYIHGTPRK